jgi:hypothetical protein
MHEAGLKNAFFEANPAVVIGEQGEPAHLIDNAFQFPTKRKYRITGWLCALVTVRETCRNGAREIRAVLRLSETRFATRRTAFA